jgi:hypothetical protein
MTAGGGTPGANQNGATPVGNLTGQGARTPGELLIAGQDKAMSATAGPDIDLGQRAAFAREAFDLAVKAPLRDRLVFDQFATWKPANLTLNGWEKVTAFFGKDIDDSSDASIAPLMENLDVDSVAFGARSVEFNAKEYGRAVSRTRLANVKTMINIDPSIVDRVARDAARASDKLARAALLSQNASYTDYDTGAAVSVTSEHAYLGAAYSAPVAADYLMPTAYGDATKHYLESTTLQVAISMLEKQNAETFMTGKYVLLTGPVGAQHIKNERDTGGFRYITARNNGTAGNDVFRGTIGEVEGADVVVVNTMPNDRALLIGKDYLGKVFTNKEGYGAQPQTVVAPVIDKLRRFMSWGWLHYVGYGVYDTRAVVRIDFDNVWRPAGAAGLGAGPAGMGTVTKWDSTY